jgi:DNA-binding NtrC family response regulator
MKILVLDELKSRKTEMTSALEKNKHKVLACATSNEFFNAIEDQSLSCICLEYETWHKGRAIYGYFNIPKKIERKPVIVYNSPIHCAGLANRVKNEKDRMLPKPTDSNTLVEAVAQCV